MKVFLLRLFATVFFSILIVSPASADYEAGSDAFDRKDYATALREFQPLADQGDAYAQFGLGRLHGSGLGVPENEPLAVHWFTRAANQNHAEAQFQLAV